MLHFYILTYIDFSYEIKNVKNNCYLHFGKKCMTSLFLITRWSLRKPISMKSLAHKNTYGIYPFIPSA